MKLVAFAVMAGILVACSGTDSTDSSSQDLHKKCIDNVMCAKGYVWSSHQCKCVPEGVECGTKHCAADEYCCSSSCGICERIGAMCPAIACQ